MFPTVAAFVLIVFFCLCGIGFAIFVVIKNKLSSELDQQIQQYLLTSGEGQVEEAENLKQEQQDQQDPENEQNQQQVNKKSDISKSLHLYYKGISQQIRSCSIELFKLQTIIMLFFALIFALGFLIWLAHEDRSGLLIFAFGLGVCCAILSTLLTLEISIASVVRTAILPHDESVISFSFLNATAISVSTTSLFLLTLSILTLSYTSIMGDSDGPAEYYTIFSSILGFSLGVAFGSLFYREAGGMSSKGILVGRDMISKSSYQNYDQTVIEVNLNTSSIISNIYNNNVIQVLDSQTLISAFICTYLLVLSQSSEIVSAAHVSFYLPIFILAVNMVTAAGVSCITLTSSSEITAQSGFPGEAAKQVRLQILICNLVSLILVVTMPLLFIDTFSIGSTASGDLNTISHAGIDTSDALWAMLTGIFAQTLLIIYAEIFTSHNYPPVQNIADVKEKNEKGSFSLTLLTATEYANISQFGIFILFSFVIILGYLISGLFGIACTITGLLSAPFSFMSVNMFAGFAAESFDIAGIGYLKKVRAKLFSFSWATHNFSIYSQIITIMGVLLTDFLCLGISVFVTKKYNVYVWDSYGIFGFLFGGSLAYFLRGVGIQGILKVAQNIKDGYLGKVESKDLKSNLKEVGQMVQGQFQKVVWKVAINIFVTLGSIVIIGLIFGLECLVCFIFGLNLVGIFLCFNSLIIGYSVKNAREYSRNYGAVTDIDDASIQSDIIVTVQEGIPGTALITYLLFFTLFFLQGADKWAQYGFFRQWVDSGEFNTLADASTDSYIDVVKGMAKAFDGENAEAQKGV